MPKIRIIPASKFMRKQHVGIYCRVSTREKQQFDSLNEQISALTRHVFYKPNWMLFDSYIDIAPGISITKRPSFQRMLQDCQDSKLDIILIKNISRLGRNTIELLEVYNKLISLGIRIISLQEDFDSTNDDASVFISILSKIAEKENTQKLLQDRTNIIIMPDGTKQRKRQNIL